MGNKKKITRLPGDLKFLFSRTPIYMVFHVTDRCNLHCAHCFKHSGRKPLCDELSTDEIDRLSTRLGHIKYLTLAGGEPMLRDDVSEIAEIFYRNNDVHFLNLVTNGWFTDKTLARVASIHENCPGVTINVGVSIDGPEAIHDQIRKKQGSFKRALDTVQALQAMASQKGRGRIFVLAHGTYNAINAGVIGTTAGYFSETLGVPYTVGLIRGNAADPGYKEIDIHRYMKTLADVQALINKTLDRDFPFRPVRLAVETMLARIVYESFANKRCIVPCQAGRRGVVLEADGNLPLCEMLDVPLGNVRENRYDVMRVLRSSQARQAIDKMIQRRCHCTWECFQRMNIVFSPRLYPGILKDSLLVMRGFSDNRGKRAFQMGP